MKIRNIVESIAPSYTQTFGAGLFSTGQFCRMYFFGCWKIPGRLYSSLRVVTSHTGRETSRRSRCNPTRGYDRIAHPFLDKALSTKYSIGLSCRPNKHKNKTRVHRALHVVCNTVKKKHTRTRTRTMKERPRSSFTANGRRWRAARTTDGPQYPPPDPPVPLSCSG